MFGKLVASALSVLPPVLPASTGSRSSWLRQVPVHRGPVAGSHPGQASSPLQQVPHRVAGTTARPVPGRPVGCVCPVATNAAKGHLISACPTFPLAKFASVTVHCSHPPSLVHGGCSLPARAPPVSVSGSFSPTRSGNVSAWALVLGHAAGPRGPSTGLVGSIPSPLAPHFPLVLFASVTGPRSSPPSVFGVPSGEGAPCALPPGRSSGRRLGTVTVG